MAIRGVIECCNIGLDENMSKITLSCQGIKLVVSWDHPIPTKKASDASHNSGLAHKQWGSGSDSLI